MDLSGILAISGKPGLYKMVSQTKTGLIVESMEDKKRIPVYAAHQISALEEISIYTYDEDISLTEVLKNMFKHLDGAAAISHKSSKNDLVELFKATLPEYDEDRVYLSDIKKVIQWYNALHTHGLIDLEENAEELEAKDTEEKE